MGSKKSHPQPTLYTHRQERIKSLILNTNTHYLIGIVKLIGKAKRRNIASIMVRGLKIVIKILKLPLLVTVLIKSTNLFSSKDLRTF